MSVKVTSSLDTDQIGKLLLKLAIPSILAQVVNLLYNVVDRIFIGHIAGVGTEALTGVGISFPIIVLIMAFAELIGGGGAPLASMEMGRQNMRGAERIMGSCLWALVLLALILTGVFYFFCDPLLKILGASASTLPYASSYLKIYLLGSVFVLITLGMNNFINAQGFAKMGMYTVVIGAVLNCLLDPWFIFGLGWGIEGAAWATVISQAVSALWVLAFLRGKKTNWKLRKADFKPVKMQVLGLGAAPFVMRSTEALLSISFNTSLQYYGGDLAVGAMTILSTIRQMVFLPLGGLSKASQPIISFNYGAKNYHRVQKTFNLVLKISILVSIICWLVIMISPGFLIRIFTSDPLLQAEAIWGIRIYLAGMFIMGVQMACQQTFISLGQAKQGLIMAIWRKLILLIPLIYIFPLLLEDQVFGVLLAEPVADVIASCTTLVLFILTTRKLYQVK